MSHNDYTKYAKENRAATPAVEPEVEPVIEAPVDIEPVVEVEPVVHPEGVYPIPVEPESTEPEIVDNLPTNPAPCKMGRVIGCAKLNVRRTPKPRAEVVCELPCDTEVEVDEAGSTIDFYKICTVTGIEGYCVKTYISVASVK